MAKLKLSPLFVILGTFLPLLAIEIVERPEEIFHKVERPPHIIFIMADDLVRKKLIMLKLNL